MEGLDLGRHEAMASRHSGSEQSEQSAANRQCCTTRQFRAGRAAEDRDNMPSVEVLESDMQIWKFMIGIGTGEQRIQMPQGAKPLSVQLQNGAPVLWALCDEGSPTVSRRI